MPTPRDRLLRSVQNTSQEKFLFLVFSTKLCGPCRKLSVTLKKWVQSHRDEIGVIVVDIHQHPMIAHEFNITGVPTVQVYHHNEVVGTAQGIYTKRALNRLFRQVKRGRMGERRGLFALFG
ncbi:MAG: thioredoxin family protein [Magnetococcales bacterium]|nr:thioredoxin family protein [Magnetococcales bacterium]